MGLRPKAQSATSHMREFQKENRCRNICRGCQHDDVEDIFTCCRGPKLRMLAVRF